MAIINGVDVGELGEAISSFEKDAARARFEFRTSTRWIDGGHNETAITAFHGGGRENDDRHFHLEADEPAILLGRDVAPNPVEHLLHALGSCLTSAMVYHAAGRGIRVDECECEVRGELDARGFLGIDANVRKGYQHIDVRMRVRADAPAAVLEECARYSPVFDVVSRSVEVDLTVECVPVEEPAVPA